MPNVMLLRHTPEPERTVAAAAKLCYSDVDADEIDRDLDEAEIKKFLGILVNMGHLSPTEHASFTFAIDGVSRALTHQLVRHRLASYSQQSQRYVTESDFDYITPPSIAANPEALAVFEETMGYLRDGYAKIRELILPDLANALIADGGSAKKSYESAEKLANEDARFVLPNACETKIVVTMNARELMHFFSQRCCNRAQWEIRELAEEMLRLVRDVAPTLFKNAGPPCVSGPCPEGAMSCGKAERVREKYLAK
jgi:thymidylate synthase (FAD)